MITRFYYNQINVLLVFIIYDKIYYIRYFIQQVISLLQFCSLLF